jgi:ATP-dependent DNA helicase RecG
MNKKEFEFLLKQGEGLKLEFKENYDSKNLAKEIVAFANTEGGRIFIGISDNGKVKSIEITNKLKSEIQDLARNCDPSVHIELETMDKILIVNVEEGLNKPYRCSAGFFLRQGSNSQKLSTEEIREFFNKEGKILFDETIHPTFSFEYGYDKSKLANYLNKAKLSQVIPDDAILKNLGVLTENKKFKNAGVLFFCDNVEKFMPQATIICVLFKGLDKRFILDKKEFRLDLCSNYEAVLKFLYANLKIAYRMEGFGPRKEILEIPENALKECLINAMTHRDYSEKGAYIQVDIFDNRVEISNPGGLIIKEEEFGTRSLSRNPTIFSLLNKLELVEHIGSGIGRIRGEMKEAGLKEPIFQFGKFFAVTLFRPNQEELGKMAGETATQKTTQKTTQKILELIEQDPKISRRELAEKIGISEDGIKFNLNQLKNQQKIRRIGPDKGGYWEIVKK